MKIVIDIPNQTYVYLTKLSIAGEILSWGERTILRGAPLPKKHGKLIDANELLKHAHDIVVPVYPTGSEYRHYCVSVDSIYEAPVIIEAESEDKNGT